MRQYKFKLKENIEYKNITKSGFDTFKKAMSDNFNKNAEAIDKDFPDIEDGQMKEIYKDGKLIGYVGFSVYDGLLDDDYKKALGIGNFIILEKGKGLGTEVIHDIVEKYKNTYDLIYCFVDAKNIGAIRLYKKLGKVYDEEGPNDNGEYYVVFYNRNNLDDLLEDYCKYELVITTKDSVSHDQFNNLNEISSKLDIYKKMVSDVIKNNKEEFFEKIPTLTLVNHEKNKVEIYYFDKSTKQIKFKPGNYKDFMQMRVDQLTETLLEVYPNKGESKKDFIKRFMSVTKDEYPDIKQRFAVANSYWNRQDRKFESLTEATRSQLISKSRKGDSYKKSEDNRWVKKTDCSIANTVKDYNKIDMNTFWKQDSLTFGVKVQGKTNTYMVYVSFNNILNRLQKEVKANKNKLTSDVIYKALLDSMNTEDVKINCSCPDYQYRLKYYASKNGFNQGKAETRPSKITNPDDTKGAACKHVLAVINNLEWLKKIASVINNYVNYYKDSMQYNYGKFIFPKIYGISYEKAVQLTIDDYDDKGELKGNLASDEALINLSNALGKVRGRFTKKENK